MNIQRYRPSAVLAPYIKEFFIIESDGVMDSRILPDTSLVMAIRFRGIIQRIGTSTTEMILADPAGTSTTVGPGVITGLRRSHRLMRYFPGTGNVLILFKEGGLAAFSRTPANELFDVTIPAENFFTKTAARDLVDAISEANDNSTRIRRTEAFLTQQLRGNGPDPLVNEAVRLIKESRGLIKIKDLAHALYISQDPLEKRFRTQIGSTPKQYSSIIRLRNIIDNWSSYPSLTSASYDAGYFDQSHFIKDFRTFTGESPKDFFRSARFW
ncbi:helix-turn-helix domain-containing protein [Puia sp. P3]|uniref:helix-turn-helix domain-containing protein n=1 Tax=Puia sp. P3 TaxID=3423952 RepID=UPI003D676A4A